MTRLLLLFASVFVLACTDTDIDEQPLALGDEALFASELQEYVGIRCGSLDCHGDMGRTLRIYAQDGLRLREGLRFATLDLEEVQHNVRSFSAFPSENADPSNNLILLKGLAVDAGGIAHKGDEVWSSPEAAGYRCIAAWLEGVSAAAACAEAGAEFATP